jgi:hypothetical protein
LLFVFKGIWYSLIPISTLHCYALLQHSFLASTNLNYKTMKKLLIAILCMVALGVVKPLQAQITKDYESLFKSLSKSEKVQLLADLRGIIDGVKKGDEFAFITNIQNN